MIARQSSQRDVLLPLLGKKEARAEFTEEQSTLLGTVPAFSLHKAGSKSHLAAALFCHGLRGGVLKRPPELRHFGVTQ